MKTVKAGPIRYVIRYVTSTIFLVFVAGTVFVARCDVLQQPFPILIIGLLLSLGMATLSHLLLRHLNQLKKTRDRIVSEATAKEAAQQALAESEASYRSVFDSASDGLVVVDADGFVVEANRAASRMFGSKPDYITGELFDDLVGFAKHELWYELREQIEERGFARRDLRVESEGRSLDLEVRGSIFTHGGEPRILLLLADMTQRKRAEQRHALLSRKALVAQEEERARISRELHDELGQLLTATRFELGLLRKHAANTSPEATRAFESSVGLIEKAAVELRHICKRLRPPMLDDLGLEPAVQQLVDEFTGHTKLEVDEEIVLEEAKRPLPKEVTLCAYRVLQESLTNVGRHAKARSVFVSLIQKPTELQASIYDDGKGFESDDLHTLEGSGMTGMRERANLVGGSLVISSAPFQGTRIQLRIPLRDRTFTEAS